MQPQQVTSVNNIIREGVPLSLIMCLLHRISVSLSLSHTHTHTLTSRAPRAHAPMRTESARCVHGGPMCPRPAVSIVIARCVHGSLCPGLGLLRVRVRVRITVYMRTHQARRGHIGSWTQRAMDTALGYTAVS